MLHTLEQDYDLVLAGIDEPTLEIAKQYNVLTVEAKGSTTVALELSISFDSTPSIEIAPAVVWYPLTLSIKVELFDGWISIEEEWEAFEKKTLKLASIQLQ